MNTKILVVICIAVAMSVSSCKDACKNKCHNGSSCVDGTCVCNSAHVGQYCEQLKCEVMNQGNVKIRASYEGYFVIYLWETPTGQSNFGEHMNNATDPTINSTDEVIFKDIPASCYRMDVAHFKIHPGQNADTVFSYNFCLEKCQNAEIVLQRL